MKDFWSTLNRWWNMSQIKRFIDMIELGLGTAAFFPQRRARPYCVDNKRVRVFDMLGTELSHKRQKNPLNIASWVSCFDHVAYFTMSSEPRRTFDIAVEMVEMIGWNKCALDCDYLMPLRGQCLPAAANLGLNQLWSISCSKGFKQETCCKLIKLRKRLKNWNWCCMKIERRTPHEIICWKISQMIQNKKWMNWEEK